MPAARDANPRRGAATLGRARAVARRPRRGCCGSVGGAAGAGRGGAAPRSPAGLSLPRRPAAAASSFPRSLSPGLRPVVGMARECAGRPRDAGLEGATAPRGWGGNQRELARQKNMKKTQEISKGKRKEDSLTTSQRKQRDSEIMQQKQKVANEKKSMQTREK
ncbi:small EDRK-rich factor 1 isoform X1 [Meriones unguiculatus]|uniref:small EDRK-rich factor 1 isoform X1 n=1 Tax=Meriones unguiculatus TaxID=10047 RepID=UPI00293E9F98|nr:small EDRK-rich factor 1 isoform X1 [Meriones unguiculatus]